MSEKIERGQSPEQLFDNSRLLIQRHLLTGPLLPRSHQQYLSGLLSARTHLLSEDDYDKELEKASASGVTKEVVAKLGKQNDSGARYLPGLILGSENEIILKRDVVEEHTDKPYTFLGILLEEVAHAYASQATRTPLLSVSESSLKLTPFVSYEQVSDYLNYCNELLEIDRERIALENVRVVSFGHSSIMQEILGSTSSPFSYPYPTEQWAQDEARALIVQAIFAAKVHGSLRRPFGTLREQLEVGMYDIEHRAKFGEEMHGNIEIGNKIMGLYLMTEPTVIESIQNLLRLLYKSDVDEFDEYTSKRKPNIHKVYSQLVKSFTNNDSN